MSSSGQGGVRPFFSLSSFELNICLRFFSTQSIWAKKEKGELSFGLLVAMKDFLDRGRVTEGSAESLQKTLRAGGVWSLRTCFLVEQKSIKRLRLLEQKLI